tara:strand:- start:321 stop:971 length:651 start_codon:yes stop_codon:yes gene_type:complete
MNFKQNSFTVIKEAIDPKIANFIYKYFLLKRKVAKTLFDTKYISPFTTYWGVWNDEQVPDTYSVYGDVAMETLLTEVKSIMEKTTELELIETYAYARIYKKGDILHKHKDRFSCEISTTMNLGGDEWPIYIAEKESDGVLKDNKYIPSNSKGVEVKLNPGDMLVYKGTVLEHWREEFKGENCGQVFFHFNNKATKGSDKNKFDNRPHLGLPSDFKA